MENGIVNFDPNIRWAAKEVLLTFAQWDYRLTKTVMVGGNCSGLTNIEGAISKFFGELYDANEDYQEIILTRADGDTLIVENDEGQDEEWLADMLIKAEILSITPEKS